MPRPVTCTASESGVAMNPNAALHTQTAKGQGNPSFSLFESISLLNECRDVAVKWLAESMDGMLARLEEDLLAQADKTVGRQQSVLLDSRAIVQQRRRDIAEHFRMRFVEKFNTRINSRPQENTTFGKLPDGRLELSLVANDDYEELLAVEDIAKRIKQQSIAELNALDQRMGLLMQRELSERDNPLGPSTIADAFKQACEDLDLPADVKLVMFDQFNQRFVSQVPAFYETLNQHLVARNVMPVISTLPRRSQAPQTQAAESARPPAADAAASAANLAQAMEQGDWQAVFAQLMGRGGMSGGPVPAVPTPAASAPVAGALPAFFQELSRLQHGGLSHDMGANILRELKAGMRVDESKDAVTIDIVAMLFDYIFDDKSIPASIKALIGRLQIPVLKVAILDARFFSRKSHPARRLLDTLAAASIGLADDDANCQRLQARLAEIVQHIVNNFEDDLNVFGEAQGMLETFLAEEERLSAEEAAKTAKAIYDRERLELARIMAVDELNQRSAQSEMPESLQTFFRKTWSEVAARCFVQGGEQGALWREALRTADDLIWSVAPKVGVEDRMRLVSLLPDLLKRLEKGVTAIRMPQEEKEAFFAALVQAHAQAIKAGVKIAADAGAKVAASARPLLATPEPAAAAAAPPAAVSPVKAQLQALDSHGFDPLAGSLAASAMPAAAMPAHAGMGGVSDTGGQADNPVGKLKRGSLVEFVGKGEQQIILKLAWVSPLKGVFLFTNRNGQNAVSIDKGDLEQKFTRGSARLIDNTALFDRAMTTMVSQLQGSA